MVVPWHKQNVRAVSFTLRIRERDSQEEHPYCTRANAGCWKGCAIVLSCTHSWVVTEDGGKLESNHKPHTDPLTHRSECTGTRGLSTAYDYMPSEQRAALPRGWLLGSQAYILFINTAIPFPADRRLCVCPSCVLSGAIGEGNSELLVLIQTWGKTNKKTA